MNAAFWLKQVQYDEYSDSTLGTDGLVHTHDFPARCGLKCANYK